MNKYEQYLRKTGGSGHTGRWIAPGTKMPIGDMPAGTRVVSQGGNGVIVVTDEKPSRAFDWTHEINRDSTYIVVRSEKNGCAFTAGKNKVYEVAE